MAQSSRETFDKNFGTLSPRHSHNFGRIADQRWVDGSGAAVDRFQYTYDYNSNPTSKKNLTNAGLSEYYTYDALDRLQGYQRGTLTFSGSTPTGTTGTTVRKDWSLDSLGNWNNVTNTTSGGTTTESRTHNAQNELTGVGPSTLTCDAKGNQFLQAGDGLDLERLAGGREAMGEDFDLRIEMPR